jgi:polar amino acid transport system substrate-binding protein
MTEAAADPRITDIVEAGVVRLGLFLPQFAEGPGGEIIPRAPGIVASELLGALAEDIRVTLRIVGYPHPPAAITALDAGEVDVIFTGIVPSRQDQIAFTDPVVQFDYAYLVPPGSPITESAEVDRPGRRISVVDGHASTMTLERLVEHAELVRSDVPAKAFALFRDGGADVFAVPRMELFDYAETLPGSRILAEGFGVNNVGFAARKDRTARRDFIQERVADARAAGLVGRILDDHGLIALGFSVPDTP